MQKLPMAPLLLAALLAGGCARSEWPGAKDTAQAPQSLETAAQASYAYTLPLFELGSTRAFYRNLFLHRPTLADASSRSVTTPNNDTLYSSAWLDLSGGPLQITLPASGDRYFSLALMDFYSNNFAVRGTRVDGGTPKILWLAGPGWDGTPPAGVELIRSPTRSVWALGRTYVLDQADIPAGVAVQAQLTVSPAAGSGPTAAQPSDQEDAPERTDWHAYFTHVQKLLAENPPPPQDAAYVQRALGPLGLLDGRFDASTLDADQLQQIARGAQHAYDAARGTVIGKAVDGWIAPQPELGNYGDSYDYRAAVALVGLGALPNAEALYFFGDGDNGTQRYDGNAVYTLEFPAGQLPPVGAFWSVTLYEAEDDGNLFFYDNAQKRYAFKSGDPGLVYEADGGLRLRFSHAEPTPGEDPNWLPAPAGLFTVVLRTYLPDAALLDGRYRLPALRKRS